MKVKEWWFGSRAKQLMQQMYPKAEFTMSNAWSQNFKHRFHIPLRRPTNTAQKEPESLRSLALNNITILSEDRQRILKYYSQTKVG